MTYAKASENTMIVQQVKATPGVTCLEALREGLETAAAHGWKGGFLLDLDKIRLTLDETDSALWRHTGTNEAECAIVLETLLFKALGAQFPCGETAPQGPYWLPVAAAPDLRLFPFDSKAKSEFLRAAHDTLKPSYIDRYLRQIEADYFDHLISAVLPGIAKSSETAQFAPGPIFTLSERVFGSVMFYEIFLNDDRADALENALASLGNILTHKSAQNDRILCDTMAQIATMQYTLAERRAMARGGFILPHTATVARGVN